LQRAHFNELPLKLPLILPDPGRFVKKNSSSNEKIVGSEPILTAFP
jgi:hypothetical protein